MTGKGYTVSQDPISKLWYVHMKGFSYIPVSGTFRETKRQAQALLKQYNPSLHK